MSHNIPVTDKTFFGDDVCGSLGDISQERNKACKAIVWVHIIQYVRARRNLAIGQRE